MKVIAIIPAAGKGTRMGPDGKKPSTLKQFEKINGIPILIHTLRVFARNPQVNQILVAIGQGEMNSFNRYLEAEKFTTPVEVVEGGDHRQDSVANALASLKADADDIVLVHDGVRPLVDDKIIANVIHEVEKHGAAIAGLPAVDTIKQVRKAEGSSLITTTLSREHVMHAQTPQGFRYELIKRAFDRAKAEDRRGTDEASLVESLDEKVWVVMGSQRNIKITTPADLELAKFLMGQNSHNHG